MTYYIPTPLILGKFHSWGDFQYHNSITRNNSIIRRQQPSLPNPHKHITVLVLPPLLLVIINIYITYNTTWTIFLSLSSGRLITNLTYWSKLNLYCFIVLFICSKFALYKKLEFIIKIIIVSASFSTGQKLGVQSTSQQSIRMVILFQHRIVFSTKRSRIWHSN